MSKIAVIISNLNEFIGIVENLAEFDIDFSNLTADELIKEGEQIAEELAREVEGLEQQIENIDDSNLLKYKDEFDYLINSGCALGVKAISDPRFPLIESSSKNLIKLYFNDVGILSNILYKHNIAAILNTDKGLNIGSVYETVSAMELIAHGHDLYYFDSKKVGEVDFLINDYNNLSFLPIEIKSGKDGYEFRAIPKLVNKEGNYKLNKGYVFTNQNICKKENELYTFPIYMIMFV